MGEAVRYATEDGPDLQEVRALCVASGFAEGMTQAEWDHMDRIFANSHLFVTARVGGRLVGLSRAMTDFVTACYIADLMVDRAFQQQGVGRALVERTRAAAGMPRRLVVLTHDRANGFYERIGLERILNGWTNPD